MAGRYVDKFKGIRSGLVDLIGDESIADRVIMYNIYSSLYSCFNEKEDDRNRIRLKAYIESVVESLCADLGLSRTFDKNTWNSFWENDNEYKEFREKYNLPNDLCVADIGNMWLQILDELDDRNSAEKICGLSKILEYIVWCSNFCEVYAYQFWCTFSNGADFEESRVSIMQYHEYREIKTFVDKMKHLTLDEQVDMLVAQYQITNFDYAYPDKETLWIDMLKKGISISESMKIVKHISKGKGLEDYMRSRLIAAGYDGEMIDSMDCCGYLKSRGLGVAKLLHTDELILGGEP